MNKSIYDIKKISNNKNYIVFLIFSLYLSLLIGFLLNENSTGGAFQDYINQKGVSKSFAKDFFNSFFEYDKFRTRHSPIVPIFFSFFEKLQIDDFYIRLISIHIGLVLPFIFFKNLQLKFKNINLLYLWAISGLIFLSPTYRSLFIWPDSRIYGLIFFLISIFFYLKIFEEIKFSYAIYSTIFYSIASYISLNFALFSIFFFLHFIKIFNYDLKKIIILILINILLSLPFFAYLLSLDNIFFLKSAVPGNEFETIDVFNISNKILIISSIILFYFVPFFILKIVNIDWKNKLNLILSLFFLIIFYFSFNYNYEWTGGGIFYKFSNLILGNNWFFFIVVFFSFIIIFDISKKDNNNILLLLILFLSNPQLTIYHKYYDPLLLIMILLLFNLNINKQKLFNFKNIFFFYMFFLSFLVISWVKLII